MAEPQVFLSYCRDNKSEVETLHDELVAAGFSVWWDQNILGGQDWKHAIRQAIQKSCAVVVCFSKEVQSRHSSGMYPELRDAIEQYRKLPPGAVYIVPVLFSECSVPPLRIDDTQTLRDLQWIELYPDAKRADGFSQLVRSLHAAAVPVVHAKEMASDNLEKLRDTIEAELQWVLHDAERRLDRKIPDYETLASLHVPVVMARGLRPKLSQAEYESLERQRARGDFEGLDFLEQTRLKLRQQEQRTKVPDLRTEELQTELPSPRETLRWEDLREHASRAVILGDPGFGKTMLLWHEVGRRCTRSLRHINGARQAAGAGEFAVFVRALHLTQELAMLAEEASPNDVLEGLVRHIGARHGLDRDTQLLLSDRIANGQCLVAIDALDEVTNLAPGGATRSLREILESCLERFAQHYASAKLVATSRLVGYAGPPFRLDDDNQLELLGFDEQQVSRSVHAWFHDDPRASNLFLKHIGGPIQVRRELCCPLLLRLACQIAEKMLQRGQPLQMWRRRSELYEVFLVDSIDQWSQRVHCTRGERSSFLPFASAVAWNLINTDARRTLWDEIEVTEAVTKARPLFPALHDRPDLADELCAAGVLVPLSRDVTGTPLMFTHRTFGEYLAAQFFKQRIEDRNLSSQEKLAAWSDVNRKSWDPDWEQTIRLTAGSLTDPSPLIEMLADPGPTEMNAHGDDVFRHRLGLAAECLAEVDASWLQREHRLVSEIGEQLLSCWWCKATSDCAPAVRHLNAAMTAVAEINLHIGGCSLSEWLLTRAFGADYAERDAAFAALHLLAGQPLQRVLSELETRVNSSLMASVFEQREYDRDSEYVLWAIQRIGRSAATPGILNGLRKLLQVATIAADESGIYESLLDTIASLRSDCVSAEIIDELLRLANLRLADIDQRSDGLLHGDKLTSMPHPRLFELEALAKLRPHLVLPIVLPRLAMLLERVQDRKQYRTYIIDLQGGDVITGGYTHAEIEETTRVLGEIGAAAKSGDVLPLLAQMLRNERDDQIVRAAARAIGNIGKAAASPETVSALYSAFERGLYCDGGELCRAAEALGTAVTFEKVWEKLSGDWSYPPRMAAAVAVGGNRALRHIANRIDELCGSENKDSFRTACRILQAVGACKATCHVVESVERAAEQWRDAALLTALPGIGPVPSVKIVKVVEAIITDDEQRQWIRAEHILGIGSLRARAVTPIIMGCLAKWLNDSTGQTRAAATVVSQIHDDRLRFFPVGTGEHSTLIVREVAELGSRPADDHVFAPHLPRA